MYELFEHTADLGLRVRAGTLEELLREAARGLLAMVVANPSAVRPVREVEIAVEAGDASYLVFDWLSELLYAFESERLLVAECEIQLQADAAEGIYRLRAGCRGEVMDESRHEMDHEVKAITYHGLVVERDADGWRAEVIVDI